MRQHPVFTWFCTLVLAVYTLSAAQAGQVITPQEREWAREALSQKSYPGTIQSSKSIAVLNFRNKTSQQRLNALQKGFALMLITDLAKVEDVVVVERTRMQALIDEMSPGASGPVDDTAAPRVGKLLQAYYVVNGEIYEGAIEELEVRSSLLDVPFESSTDLPPAPGNLDELFRMEKDVLFYLLEELNVFLAPEKKKELEVPMSWSTPALFALFLGIDHSDNGRYKDAADMYNRAIAEDPDLRLAKEALQELQSLGLTENQAIPRTETAPASPPVEEGGTGVGTVVAVGLGVAAIAGGAVLLGSSSSSDSGGGGEPAEPTQPTARVSETAVQCYSDDVLVTFSQQMNTQLGFITSSPSEFEVSGQWLDAQNYRISWNLTDFCDTSPLSATITLNNFRAEGENGAELGGQTEFALNFTDI